LATFKPRCQGIIHCARGLRSPLSDASHVPFNACLVSFRTVQRSSRVDDLRLFVTQLPLLLRRFSFQRLVAYRYHIISLHALEKHRCFYSALFLSLKSLRPRGRSRSHLIVSFTRRLVQDAIRIVKLGTKASLLISQRTVGLSVRIESADPAASSRCANRTCRMIQEETRLRDAIRPSCSAAGFGERGSGRRDEASSRIGAYAVIRAIAVNYRSIIAWRCMIYESSRENPPSVNERSDRTRRYLAAAYNLRARCARDAAFHFLRIL